MDGTPVGTGPDGDGDGELGAELLGDGPDGDGDGELDADLEELDGAAGRCGNRFGPEKCGLRASNNAMETPATASAAAPAPTVAPRTRA
jgi:hypothetical protein